MTGQFEHLVEAWEQSARSIIGLVDVLSEEEWAIPSRCPGWSIKDVVSHNIGLERLLLGESLPSHDPGEKPWVKNDFGRMMEIDVDLRRSRSGSDVGEEFREVVDARHLLLSQMKGEEEVTFLNYTGPVWKTFLRRIIDVWMHEQDIRAALGNPGGMDTFAAHFTYDALSSQFAKALSGKGLPVGGFTIRTPMFERSYIVDGEGSVSLVEGEQSTVLSMSPENWASLLGGRDDAAPADISVTGDAALATQVIALMGITP
jgi:uncharacterized protein (TIGR03083 family)